METFDSDKGAMSAHIFRVEAKTRVEPGVSRRLLDFADRVAPIFNKSFYFFDGDDAANHALAYRNALAVCSHNHF